MTTTILASEQILEVTHMPLHSVNVFKYSTQGIFFLMMYNLILECDMFMLFFQCFEEIARNVKKTAEWYEVCLRRTANDLHLMLHNSKTIRRVS